MLTDAQRRKLSELLTHAFIAIRYLGWEGHAQQAADLADALHNVPMGIWWPDFSLQQLRDIHLANYQHKYPENGRYYVAKIDEIIAMNE